jgi:hypothetical protein
MTLTVDSKRDIFQTIVDHPDYHWPYYRLPDTKYTVVDLGALEHDVHRLARANPLFHINRYGTIVYG